VSKQLPQHWITPEKLANTGLDLHLELDGDTAPLVAEAIGVDQILSLSANLKVRTAKAAGVVIHGTIKARVEQKCVVTLKIPSRTNFSAILCRSLPAMMPSLRLSMGKWCSIPITIVYPMCFAAPALTFGM